MSQGSTGTRIADDYPSIAARLRELNNRSRQVAARLDCGDCDNRGWVWSAYIPAWRRCPHCGMYQHCPKPQPGR